MTVSPPAAPWHARPAADALRALGTSAQGLAPEEAARRLAEHGPNALPQARRRHPIVRLLAQFNNALIYFLLAAAVAAAVLAHFVDAAVIVAVVLVNAIIGFVQEGKAEAALEAMHKLISPQEIGRAHV